MAYNELEMEMLFKKAWKIYPSKEKELSALKAFKVMLRSGEDWKMFLKAVEIYALDTAGDEYHYNFGNFIREEHWKDIIDGAKNPDEYLRLLKEKEDECLEIIETWNNLRKKHWCAVLSERDKIPIVKKALANEYFRNNWKEALLRAAVIFEFRFRYDDWRCNIIISIRWFCKVEPESHTVLRIMEGEFGSAVDRRNKEVCPIALKELTPTDRKELIDLWNDIRAGKITEDEKPKKKKKRNLEDLL